jgi:hypothetical protein
MWGYFRLYFLRNKEKNHAKFPNVFFIPSVARRTLGRLFNPLNAELNPTCHLLTLLGDHHILHISRIRVKMQCEGHSVEGAGIQF